MTSDHRYSAYSASDFAVAVRLTEDEFGGRSVVFIVMHLCHLRIRGGRTRLPQKS